MPTPTIEITRPDAAEVGGRPSQKIDIPSTPIDLSPPILKIPRPGEFFLAEVATNQSLLRQRLGVLIRIKNKHSTLRRSSETDLYTEREPEDKGKQQEELGEQLTKIQQKAEQLKIIHDGLVASPDPWTQAVPAEALDEGLARAEAYVDTQGEYVVDSRNLRQEARAVHLQEMNKLAAMVEDPNNQKNLPAWLRKMTVEGLKFFRQGGNLQTLEQIRGQVYTEAVKHLRKPKLFRLVTSEKNRFYSQIVAQHEAIISSQKAIYAVNGLPFMRITNYSYEHQALEMSMAHWARTAIDHDTYKEIFRSRDIQDGDYSELADLMDAYPAFHREHIRSLFAPDHGELSEADLNRLVTHYGLDIAYHELPSEVQLIRDIIKTAGFREWHQRYRVIASTYGQIMQDYGNGYMTAVVDPEHILISGAEFYLRDHERDTPGISPLVFQFIKERSSIGAIARKLEEEVVRNRREMREYFSALTTREQFQALLHDHQSANRLITNLQILKNTDRIDPVIFPNLITAIGALSSNSPYRDVAYQVGLIWIRLLDRNPDSLNLSPQELQSLSGLQRQAYDALAGGSYDLFLSALRLSASPRRLAAESDYNFNELRQARMKLFDTSNPDLAGLSSEDEFTRGDAYLELGGPDFGFDSVFHEALLLHELSLPNRSADIISDLIRRITINQREASRFLRSELPPTPIVDILAEHNHLPTQFQDILVRLNSISQTVAVNFLVIALNNPERAAQIEANLVSFMDRSSQVAPNIGAIFQDENLLSWIIEDQDKSRELSLLVEPFSNDPRQAQMCVMTVKFLRRHQSHGEDSVVDANLVSGYIRLFGEFAPEDILEITDRYTRDGIINPYNTSDISRLREFVSNFGALHTPELLKAFIGIQEGREPNEPLKQIGVTSSGREGVRQLATAYRQVAQALITKGVLVYDINNLVVEDVVSVITRFKTGEFAGWGKGRLRDVAKQVAVDTASGFIAGLPAGYAPAEIRVQKLKQDSEFTFTQPAVDKFNQLRIDLLNAIAFAGSDKEEVLGRSRSRVQSALQESIQQLQQQAATLDERLTAQGVQDETRRAAATRGLSTQITKLGEGHAKLTRAEDIDELIVSLIDAGQGIGEKRAAEAIIRATRRLLFYKTIKANPNYGKDPLGVPQSRIDASGLNMQAVLALMETVQTGIGFEVLPTLGLKNDQKRYINKSIIDLTVFNDEIKRSQEIATGQFETFTIYPGRGLLAELSGYYSDACWTQESNILRKNPNLVGAVFSRQVRDIPAISGGSLFIATKLQNGESALMIRGINPRENTIRQLHAGDFFEKVTDAANEWAKALGIKHIIAPAGSSGALSNRPTINAYFGSRYNQRVSLGETVNFNGYDVTANCFLVRTVA